MNFEKPPGGVSTHLRFTFILAGPLLETNAKNYGQITPAEKNHHLKSFALPRSTVMLNSPISP